MQRTKSYGRWVAVAGLAGAFIASACGATSTPGDGESRAGGSGTAGDGAAGLGTAGTAAAGSGTAGSGIAGSGIAGAGIAGSGIAGAGTAGAGTAGAGTAGAGTAGAGTAGSGTAGAPNGAAGTAGAGTAGAPNGGAPPVSFQCDPSEGGAVGIPASCAPSDSSNVCQQCVKAKCCDLYGACYATNPGNQCGWGGPLKVNGMPNVGGEALCIQLCLQKLVGASGTAPEDSDVRTCAAQCATTGNGAAKECGSVIGLQTSDLLECLLRDCSVACFGA